jgi:hypothetical protein
MCRKNKSFGTALLIKQRSKKLLKLCCIDHSSLFLSFFFFFFLARNLIDISSAQTDPLQDTDAQERYNKYRSLLEQIKPTVTNNLIHSNNNINVLDVLTNAKPNGGMTDGEVDWLYQTMDEIQDALQHIDIEPVGDMVVHLTMTDNSSTIRSY